MGKRKKTDEAMKNTQPPAAHRRILRHLSNLCLNACLALATLTGPTACQQDMPAADNALPDGKYPVLISAIAPQTRALDNGNRSEWEDGDRISVTLLDTPDEVGIYEVNKDGMVTQVIKPLYFRSTAPNQKIRAWYPATESSDDITIDLRDKENFWLYGDTRVQDITQPVSITMGHLYPKLRVELEGATEGMVHKVEMDAICLVYFSPNDPTFVTMTMQKDVKRIGLQHKGTDWQGLDIWEGYAGSGSHVGQIYINGEPVQLTKTFTMSNQYLYTVNITVHPTDKEETINLDTLTNTYRITKKGKYHFTGKVSNVGFTPIVVEAPATLELDNVGLYPKGEFALYIKAPGTTTIKLKGNNYLGTVDFSGSSKAGITLDGADTHLLIEGPDTLTLNSYVHAAIGTPYKQGEKVACGDITIKNATINTCNSTISDENPGAYIGTGKCEATGSQTHGNITIANSLIKGYTKKDTQSYAIGTVADEGLRSPDNGEINIYLMENQTANDFINNFKGNVYRVDPRAKFHHYEETPDWLK